MSYTILFTEDQIAHRIEAMADNIVKDISEEILLVPIMTGSIIFAADLMRSLKTSIKIEIIIAKSYLGQTSSQQDVEIPHVGNCASFQNANVLLVDDIVDSGKTLTKTKDLILKYNPLTLKTCVLLRKNKNYNVDYWGFDIPPSIFVAGYGLDYQDKYRNLSHIITL